MIKIGLGDPNAAMPYAHLLPLVETLLAHGNMLRFDGDAFLLTRDGWWCELRNPIDFDLIEATFTFPELIVCSQRHDAIVDGLTRSEISGPGGRPSRFASPDTGLATVSKLDLYLVYQRYAKQTSTVDLAAKTGLTRHAVDTRLWRLAKIIHNINPSAG